MASAVLEGDISSPSHSYDGGARSLPLALAPDVRVTASAHGSLVYRRSTGLIARVGPIEWEVLRSRDDTYKFRHFSTWHDKLDFDRLSPFCNVSLPATLSESPS